MNEKEKEDISRDEPIKEGGEGSAGEIKKEDFSASGQEYEVLWDKHMRLCAEFENSRKRWCREKDEVMKFANFSLLAELLVILDETEQALKMAQEHRNIEEIVKGIELTAVNFNSIFKRRGLEKIEAEGKKFDPHLHEIVAGRESDKEEDEYKVLEEIQKGYLLAGKVLRTSKVIVGVRKQRTENGEQKADNREGEENTEERDKKT